MRFDERITDIGIRINVLFIANDVVRVDSEGVDGLGVRTNRSPAHSTKHCVPKQRITSYSLHTKYVKVYYFQKTHPDSAGGHTLYYTLHYLRLNKLLYNMDTAAE